MNSFHSPVIAQLQQTGTVNRCNIQMRAFTNFLKIENGFFIRYRKNNFFYKFIRCFIQLLISFIKFFELYCSFCIVIIENN